MYTVYHSIFSAHFSPKVFLVMNACFFLFVFNLLTADLTFNRKSAHFLLEVSNDGKSLYQASLDSPFRAPTAETYLICICVSSNVLPTTRVYFDLHVTQTVPWTLGFRTASFNADYFPDFTPGAGIWTIASAGGKIIINDGKGIPTSYNTPPRLRLYLDYRRGQLSFYDAVLKFHLYTFVASFKEKLLFYAAVDVGIEEVHGAVITFS